ncbi:MAG TPA: DUF4333 domain-containing protein [Kofleriaceae bacterium]|nr:DUF4333 domain-containing protein [Kofleriaceae bacterium]
MFAVILAAVSGAACKAKVDTGGFEDTIRQHAHDLGLSATKVACPKDVEARPGKAFTCQVEIDGKKTYALDVTLKGVDPGTQKVSLDTAWHDGAAVQAAKLEPALTDELSKLLGAAVKIKCGDAPLIFLDPQRKTRCELSAGAIKTTATIEFNEALAPTDWHLDPPLLGRSRLESVLMPSVRDRMNAEVKLDCGPAELLLRPADGVLWCSVTAPDKQVKIKVVVDDTLNVQSWEIATPPG